MEGLAPSKNWACGMGEPYREETWSLLRQYTSCQPGRVSWKSRPVRMGTGPRTTRLPLCTHSNWRSMSTQVTRWERTGQSPAALGSGRAATTSIVRKVATPG